MKPTELLQALDTPDPGIVQLLFDVEVGGILVVSTPSPESEHEPPPWEYEPVS